MKSVHEERLSHESITAALIIVTQKVLIYKLRVAAGLVSADDKVGDKPPPYADQNSCLLRQPLDICRPLSGWAGQNQ